MNLNAGIEDLALDAGASQLNDGAMKVGEEEDFDQMMDGMRGGSADHTAEHACR